MSFTEVLNLSISASWLVVAIIAVRYLLKAAPKALHCALWALVAVRLLCPVSIESDLSLIPSREVIPESYLQMEPSSAGYDAPARLEIVTNPVYEESVTVPTETTVDRVQHWDVYATVFWLAGMGAMAVYAAYSYLSIRLRVRMAAWSGGNVWECDDIDSPFILGLLRPRIYLPSGLDNAVKSHVLAHENAHLKRLDHVWKPLGFALLTVHWFNPIMWLGYILLCRDIELACDEKVIKGLEKPDVRAYSEALVLCAVSQRRIAMCPLAFGEVGVKGRIKSMLSYKKPGFWVMVIAIVVCIGVAVCFLTDPAEKPNTLKHIREEDGCTIVSQTPETLHIEIYKDFLPAKVLNGKLHTFEEDEFILHRTETTAIYLESARLYGNELMLTLNFRYEIPESGTILLPYQVEDGGRVWTAALPDDSDARIIQYGPDPAVSIGIDMDLYENAAEYITFDLCNMNLLTYRADHLLDAPTTGQTKLDAILHEDGYTVRWCPSETLSFMFYTHWIPAGFESGYDFADGELVVMETETTKLQMVHAELRGEQYRFDFAFTYDLPASGTIITPCDVNIKGIRDTMFLDWEKTYDQSRSYEAGVQMEHVSRTDAFTLLVDKELYENLDSFLCVTLENVCSLTYAENSMRLPFDAYLDISEHLGSGVFERFVISYDLHLIGCEPEILFPVQRELGALHVTTLEGTPVSEDLKKRNLWAWRCEAYGSIYLLLQQTDDTLYVIALSEDGTKVTDLYRVERADDYRHHSEAGVYGYRYSLAVTDSFDVPTFTLFSDGTFQLHVSALSSYIGFGGYTLTESELTLRTGDGLYVWNFHVTENGFAFDSENSSPIRYMKDLKYQTDVLDGEVFRSPEANNYEPPELEQSVEEAISAAILRHNIVDQSGSSIYVESHKILAELAVCGAATTEGEPMEELIVYLYAHYSELGTDTTRFYIEENKRFPAVLSFTITESGYELLEYRELSDEEAEAEFPAFAWADWEENGYEYETELNRAGKTKETAQLEALREQIGEAERLLKIVASGPLQYSNPGAYIDAHSQEWEQLLELGAATVHYSFHQLSVEDAQGLEAYLMALACQEIIEDWGEDCAVEEYYNGENWFSLFAQHADTVSDTIRWKELRRTHPACVLATIYTQWQEHPPP